VGIALFVSTGLTGGVMESACVHFRPRAVLAAKGWISPHWTKFGTCYMSESESFFASKYFLLELPIFLVLFLAAWPIRNELSRNLTSNFFSVGRVILMLVVSCALYTGLWYITSV
jgi:hypothetical protein